MRVDVVPTGKIGEASELLSEASGLMLAVMVVLVVAAVFAAYQLVGNVLQYLDERTRSS